MLAMKIIAHSVFLILRNFGMALKLSLPYFLTLFIIAYLLRGTLLDFTSGLPERPARFGTLKIFLSLGLHIGVMTWLAIAWHRFILVGEIVEGLNFEFNLARVLVYFWKGLLIGLILLVPAILLAVALSGLIFEHPLLYLAAHLIATVAASWVFYRFSLVLPAAALENPLSLRASWASTAPVKWTILLISVLMIMIYAVPQILLFLLLDTPTGVMLGPIGWQVLRGTADWISIMIAVSVLTSLYGHVIERRALSV